MLTLNRAQGVLMDELRARNVAVPSAAECEEIRAIKENERQASSSQGSKMWQLAIFLLLASGLGLSGILTRGEKRAWLIDAFQEVFQPERYYLKQGVDSLRKNDQKQTGKYMQFKGLGAKTAGPPVLLNASEQGRRTFHAIAVPTYLSMVL